MLRSSSICATFLYNYLLSDSEETDEKGEFKKKCQKLKCLSKTLESYGGVLSKLSQILSLDDENNTVFSDCKPFSKDQTIEFLKKNYNNKVKNIDFNVHKSGSVGQVHLAKYKEKDIIIKVQYVGLLEQTSTDLKMLDTITSYLYYFADMSNAMVDIKTKMFEELNYIKEAKNQNLIYKLFRGNKYIQIPKVIKKLSNDKILYMEYIKGESVQDFIVNSTQEEKNIFGTCIVKFIFESIYKHGILYSDIHYGNLIVKKDNTLAVIDFGCIHILNNTLCENMKNLHKALNKRDKNFFYNTVMDLGIIQKNISKESKEYIYNYFTLQYEPWITNNFEFSEEWLEKSKQKNTELMKEWILPQSMVYMNKIPYGAYHILTKLKLKGDFKSIINNILM